MIDKLARVATLAQASVRGELALEVTEALESLKAVMRLAQQTYQHQEITAL